MPRRARTVRSTSRLSADASTIKTLGGVVGGQSGMGRELGYHGLNDFLEIKQIFTDGTGLAMKPPYGQVIKG